MKKIDIHNVHKDCLDYLLKYQIDHKNFYFVPRKRNNKNRLEEGMYFIGNDEYLQITFWEGSDSKEKIYNIALVINNKMETFIEMSCRDNEERAVYTNNLAIVLSVETSRKFDLIKENKWRCYYPTGTAYLNALSDFIMKVKPIVDDYLLKNTASGITLASKETDDEYVKKLPGYIAFFEAVSKAKKTGEIVAKASEYIMTFQHNQLSNELETYLKHSEYSKDRKSVV